VTLSVAKDMSMLLVNTARLKKDTSYRVFVYLVTDQSDVIRLTLYGVASCKPPACWEKALLYVTWHTKIY
jgi:hypothetical protein